MPTAPDHLQRVELVFDVEPMRAKASSTFAQTGRTERYGFLAIRRLLNLTDRATCLVDQRTQCDLYTQIFRLNDLERLSVWFTDWPQGFLNKIQTVRADFLSAELSFRPKTILLAHAFPAIKDVLDTEARIVERNADEDHRGAALAVPRQVHPRDVVDIQTISKITGCQYKVVITWIKGGALGDVVSYVDRGGNRRYEIDGQRAREVAQFFARTSTISSLAKMVGTESRALHRLALTEVFPFYRVSNGTELARIPPEPLLEIVRRLVGSTSHDASVSDSALSFSQALRRLTQSTPQEIRQFINELGTKVLPLVCRVANPTRLDEVLVNDKSFRSWRKLHSHRLKT